MHAFFVGINDLGQVIYVGLLTVSGQTEGCVMVSNDFVTCHNLTQTTLIQKVQTIFKICE